MINKWDKVWITSLLIILMGSLMIVAFIAKEDNSKAGFGCDINNIEYMDVSPYNCWNPDINSKFCPMPKDISCNGDVEGIGELLIRMIMMAE